MDNDRDTSVDKNEALLKEIRERYDYLSQCWAEARKESQLDRRYLAGDPFPPAERKLREDPDNPRPLVNHDELTQYVNQSVNFVRQNKRGVKVSPGGNGATDKTAEFRQDLWRTIEYKSHAQQAYTTAFEQMVQGSYGGFRLSRRYAHNDPTRRDASLFDQEIIIRAIPNQDSVLYDWDCKEPDWSDARDCFVLDPIPHADFKRRYPRAKKTNFVSEDMRNAPQWVQDKTVLVAEYWRIEIEPYTYYLLDTGEIVDLDTMPKGARVQRKRTVERKQVVQYITNGLEILERTEQPGEEIPIILMTGRQMYMDEGGRAKRILFSLPRLARDAQLSLAYLCSQQMEESGLTPKVPYLGYTGQFETDGDAWATAHKIPHAYLQADPIVDGSNGAILPLPQRVPFTPNFAAYEIAKDSCRRAIQAAMGISPLPTAAQRNNEKSGVALQAIQQQMQIGSYHFVDNYERAIERAGRIGDSWMKVTYDTEREMALRKPDDTHNLIRMNTEAPYPHPETGEPQHFQMGEESHDVTVSAAPSYESQREEAAGFLDLLVANLGKLPAAPPQQAKLLSLAIKMKSLGPIGDQMADIISPDQQQEVPPQAQAAIAQFQQQLQALNAYAQQVESENQQLKQKIESKVIESESRERIEQMKIEADITKAEINTKAQNVMERLAFIEDMMKQLQIHRHEASMAQQQQDHQRSLAQDQAVAQAVQGDADRQHTAEQSGLDRQAASNQAAVQLEAQQNQPQPQQ